MTEEERRLMLKIAESIEKQGKAIEALMQGRPAAPQVLELPDINQRPVVQTIEQNTAGHRFRLDVRFEGVESMPYEERMQKAEQFLSEVLRVFRGFGVISLTGSYVRQTIQA